MLITVDTDTIYEWEANINRALGCIDFAKSRLDCTKDAEEWPDVEFNVSSIESSMDSVIAYLEKTLESMHQEETEGLLVSH